MNTNTDETGRIEPSELPEDNLPQYLRLYYWLGETYTSLSISETDIDSSMQKEIYNLIVQCQPYKKEEYEVYSSMRIWVRDFISNAGVDPVPTDATLFSYVYNTDTEKYEFDLRPTFRHLQDEGLYSGNLTDTNPSEYQPQDLIDRAANNRAQIEAWCVGAEKYKNDFLQSDINTRISQGTDLEIIDRKMKIRLRGRASNRSNFPYYAGSEMGAVQDALGDGITAGKPNSNWKIDRQLGVVNHTKKGSEYTSVYKTTNADWENDLNTDCLLKELNDLGTDSYYAILYVIEQLLGTGKAWIDLNACASNIGLVSRSTEESVKIRKLIYNAFKFGAHLHMKGDRDLPYKDTNNKPIDTKMDGPMWAFLDFEWASLRLFEDESPYGVEIAMSTRIHEILSNPTISQWVPLANRVASIMPNRPSGAWARTIGAVLATDFRRNPVAWSEGKRNKTRRHLLSGMTPNGITPAHLLFGTEEEKSEGKNPAHPSHAKKYWAAALKLLSDNGLIAWSDEAKKPNTGTYPYSGWQKGWLDETVVLRPGKDMLLHLNQIASHIHPKLISAVRSEVKKIDS